MRFKKFYIGEAEDLPILLMTIGIPGSGKSTWIDKQKGFKVISPDRIRKKVTGDISDVSQDSTVWKITTKKISDHLKKGQNAILDATNVDTIRRADFLRGLPKHKLQAKIFKLSAAEAKKRIKKDIDSGKDRSNVPPDIIDTMAKKFKEGLGDLKKQGFEIVK